MDAAQEEEEEWRVAHDRVIRRAEPSKDAPILGMERSGTIVKGSVIEAAGTRWLQTPMSSGAASFMMVDGASVGLGTLLERVAQGAQEVPICDGDYHVLQGPLFKKPGADPTTGKVLKLTRPVGSVVRSTGRTWQGPAGGEWLQLDGAAAGEKPGWLLIEGPGFNVPGPLLAKADPGQGRPLVLKLYSMIKSEELCEVCVPRGETIAGLKRWIALRDPHGLKPGKILVAKEMPTEGEHSFSIAFFPTHKLHLDATSMQEAGFKAGDPVPYFYLGEANDDGRFSG